MPRKYTVEFEAQPWLTADGDIDIFEFTAATDKPIAVTGLTLKTTSETTEGQEEWLRIRAIRGHTTSGSGSPGTVTPRPLSPYDAAAGFTAEFLNDAIASAGTPINLDSDAFQVRNGYELWLPPEDWWWTSAGIGFLVVRGMAAPVDDVTMTGTCYVLEVP
jgi:hypothetical protein